MSTTTSNNYSLFSDLNSVRSEPLTTNFDDNFSLCSTSSRKSERSDHKYSEASARSRKSNSSDKTVRKEPSVSSVRSTRKEPSVASVKTVRSSRKDNSVASKRSSRSRVSERRLVPIREYSPPVHNPPPRQDISVATRRTLSKYDTRPEERSYSELNDTPFGANIKEAVYPISKRPICQPEDMPFELHPNRYDRNGNVKRNIASDGVERRLVILREVIPNIREEVNGRIVTTFQNGQFERVVDGQIRTTWN